MELPAAFSQRIKSTPLTAKEALVAEYILNNFLSVCYVSTSELARILGVSDATVSRTSKVLGYRSFLDLQKEIQSFVSQKADYAQRGFFPPIERLHTHQSLDAKENIVAQFSTLTYKNLQSVLEIRKLAEQSDAVLEAWFPGSEGGHAAADLLCSCRIKYIAGRRPTAPIAEKFSFLMRMVVPGVVSATGSVTFEQLLDISPEDCLFVINFNPYGEEVRRWIDLAHSRGAKIILLTDKPSTPFSDFTDVLLLADIYSVSFFNSNVSATFLLELLVSLVADQMDETATKRLDLLNPYFERNKR